MTSASETSSATRDGRRSCYSYKTKNVDPSKPLTDQIAKQVTYHRRPNPRLNCPPSAAPRPPSLRPASRAVKPSPRSLRSLGDPCGASGLDRPSGGPGGGLAGAAPGGMGRFATAILPGRSALWGTSVLSGGTRAWR